MIHPIASDLLRLCYLLITLFVTFFTYTTCIKNDCRPFVAHLSFWGLLRKIGKGDAGYSPIQHIRRQMEAKISFASTDHRKVLLRRSRALLEVQQPAYHSSGCCTCHVDS